MKAKARETNDCVTFPTVHSDEFPEQSLWTKNSVIIQYLH